MMGARETRGAQKRPRGCGSGGRKESAKAIITVRVLPRSSRDQIGGKEGDLLKVKLIAPPVEGRANRSLKQILAKTLGVPKRSVEIISGERSRTKTVQIHGLDVEEVNKILAGFSGDPE